MPEMQIKNIIKIFVATFVVFFGGCKENVPQEIEKIKITVSIPTYKGITEKIGGEKVEVACLLPPGFNPPEFDPTPNVLKIAANADVYIRVGEFFDFENIWLSKIAAVKNDLVIFDSSIGIEEKDHNHHVWNGTAEVKIIAANIREKLSGLDKKNADYYLSNYISFLAKIDSVNSIVKERLNRLKLKTIVTYHPAWTYFTDTYGLKQISIEDHGKLPKTKDLILLVNKARSLGIKAVFVQPQFDNNTARIIADEIGASLVEIDPLPEDFLANLIDVTNKIEKYNE